MSSGSSERLRGVDGADQDAVVLLTKQRQRLLLGRLGPDRCRLTAVDDLARLRLAVERFGWTVRLEGATDEFLELLDLCGLREVFDA